MPLSHMWISRDRVNGDYNYKGQPCPYGVLGMIKKESTVKSTVKGGIDVTIGGNFLNGIASTFVSVPIMAAMKKMQYTPVLTGDVLGDAFILSFNAASAFSFCYLARHNMKEPLAYPQSPRFNPYPASERATATRRNARLLTCGVMSVFYGVATYGLANQNLKPDVAAQPPVVASPIEDSTINVRFHSGNKSCIKYVIDPKTQVARQQSCTPSQL